jgi:hypothetical protein
VGGHERIWIFTLNLNSAISASDNAYINEEVIVKNVFLVSNISMENHSRLPIIFATVLLPIFYPYQIIKFFINT